MHDMISASPSTGSSEKEDFEKKYSELCCRISSLQYAAEDYDRIKGKGAFRREHKLESTILDSLLNKKIAMAAEKALKPREEKKPETSPAPTLASY